MLKQARKFTDNSHLSDSLKITISSVIPFLILLPYKEFTLAFTIAMGALLTSPVDIPSSFKDKIVGLLTGAIAIPFITFLLSITLGHWTFYPIFIGIIFSLSMIAVYGHRANMLSFTGLLAVCLAFAHNYDEEGVLTHCLMLLLGGLLYTLVSVIFQLIRPRRYAILQTSDCLELTSKYLKYRAELWSKNANTQKIVEKQLNIQIKLNEIHQNLREYLIKNKANTGNSANNRKLLVAFSELVEIQEMAVSTNFDHQRLHELFKGHEDIIQCYQQLAFQFSETIYNIGTTLNMGDKYRTPSNLTKALEELKSKLKDFEQTTNAPTRIEAVLQFSNVIHYAESQIEKIKGLERVLLDKVFDANIEEQFKDLEKFLTPQHYRWSTLKENFNFSSIIFRHAVRLTITILIGFLIGQIFNLLNGYWILLTIVVIMRPGYGLTKQRSFERVIGTVIGGLIAFALLYFIKEVNYLAYLTVFTMIMGYWFSHTDYKVGVTFITIYVVLIFGILTPNFMDLLVYRIIDTFLGAILAFGANYLLWPSWEFLNVNKHLSNSIKANRDYIKEISIYYNEKGAVTLPYKLARKYAFIEVGNLMASFQRMIQEPKSKQKYRAELYELAVLNHTLLSSAASIGTYIQSRKTTEASKAFNSVMDYIINNLNTTSIILEELESKVPSVAAKEEFQISYLYLKEIRETELKQSLSNDLDIQEKMEESVLVIEQLMWMVKLSDKILKIAQKINFKSQINKQIQTKKVLSL